MPDRITEIRARLDAATPGPWVQHNKDVDRLDGIRGPHDGPYEWWHGLFTAWESKADAEFVAHAPADIAWLLNEVDASRERIALLRAEVDDLDRIRRMYQEVKS